MTYSAEFTEALNSFNSAADKSAAKVKLLGAGAEDTGRKAGFMGEQFKKAASSTIEQARSIVLSYVGIQGAISGATYLYNKFREAQQKSLDDKKAIQSAGSAFVYSDPVAVAQVTSQFAAIPDVGADKARDLVQAFGKAFIDEAKKPAKVGDLVQALTFAMAAERAGASAIEAITQYGALEGRGISEPGKAIAGAALLGIPVSEIRTPADAARIGAGNPMAQLAQRAVDAKEYLRREYAMPESSYARDYSDPSSAGHDAARMMMGRPAIVDVRVVNGLSAKGD